MVVETSPGNFHFYWLVADHWPADGLGKVDFAAVLECMVADYGSDKAAKDISRVLRVPGFMHRKNPPKSPSCAHNRRQRRSIHSTSDCRGVSCTDKAAAQPQRRIHTERRQLDGASAMR